MDRNIIKCSDMDQMVSVISLLLNLGLDFTAEADKHIIYIWGQ